MVRKLIMRFARRSGRLEILHGRSHKKKGESVLELGRTQRIRYEGLERFVSEAESVEKFGGIVD